ncbi:MAG: PQQ-dependent dehydrogenase, methanol/ethanol family, partial [gamma proteobacterium symbiont of Ctena orbiculata]
MVKAKRKVLAICFTASAMLSAAGGVTANSELLKMQNNPNDWVMPNGDYAGTRYSKLDQINTSNVKDLRVAWTFSTG